MLLDIDDERSERYLSCALSNIDGLKPGWTRLNLAPWASDEEVEFLLSAVEFVAEHGARFLPLYTFDWMGGAWTHPQDAAPMDLFGTDRPRTGEGEVPFAAYLAEARRIVDTLPPAGEGRAVPEFVPADLVFFAH